MKSIFHFQWHSDVKHHIGKFIEKKIEKQAENPLQSFLYILDSLQW